MVDMPTRPLGTSGTMVSQICLGTMMFGGPTDEAQSRRIVDHAFEHGVNFIDTANAYTETRSEEIVGRLIRDKRQSWVLATKVGNATGKGPLERGLSRVHVMAAAEQSLRRLRTDVIDLYYIHRVDARASWEQIVLTFGDLIRQGKVREWGLSNVRGWQIAHVCHLARELGVPPPTALQPYYNLLNRQPEVE